MNEKARQSLSDNIEERFGLWLNHSIYSIAIRDMIKIGDSVGLFKEEELQEAGLIDSINNHLLTNMDMEFFNIMDDQDNMDDLAEIIGKIIALDSVDIEKLQIATNRAYLEDKYQNDFFSELGEEYSNYLILPGKLIDTNAEEIHGDTIKWQFDFVKCIDSDYTMYAESRTTNNWAYLVSGFILAVAFIIPFLKSRKQS